MSTTTCTACRTRLDEPFGTEGLCVDCHRTTYGPNHMPTAIRVEGLTSGDVFVATCAFRCAVLDGLQLTPRPDRADAIEESRRLHRQAMAYTSEARAS